MDYNNESQRRLSQNGRMMRGIVDRLRDYTLDEVRVICEKYLRRHGSHPSGRRRRLQAAPDEASAPSSAEDAPPEETPPDATPGPDAP